MSKRSRERGWPASPEPLPAPVVDNHTHLDGVLAFEASLGGVRDPGADAVRMDSAGTDRIGVADGATTAAERGQHSGPGQGSGRTLEEHLALAAAVGVTRMVQIGCDLDSAAWTVAALREQSALLGGVAIHPNEAVLHAGVREVAPDGLDHLPEPRHETSLEGAIERVAALAAAEPRIRVIGETGLDYFRAGDAGREVQRESFRAHIALAKELDLVLQIHDRDAHSDVIDTLLRDGAPKRTVFHCFSGDAEMALRCAGLGWYLSFAGPVTFRGNDGLRAALRATPPSRVLVETDAPYLTPHPNRGRPNAPYQIPHTVRTVAAELGLSLAEACALIDRTSRDLYGF